MSIIPSVNKGKYAWQRAFSALFALFALTGVSPPAPQKTKITRKFIADRCKAVLPEQKCGQTRKDPKRILAVLSRGLTRYGRISARQNRVCPCQPMVQLPSKTAYYTSFRQVFGSQAISVSLFSKYHTFSSMSICSIYNILNLFY